MKKNRAGVFMNQPSGYKSFKPAKLPPDPPICIDSEMLKLLSDADRKLGRLDGATQTLPNPALFVAMYVKKEALLSSQIEGTQASFIDILGTDENSIKSDNVAEVVNYVAAMDYGLTRMESFPLSLRLIREIHAKLLAGTRGSNRNPGEFRKTQNWIGAAGCSLNTATFVPPALPDMQEALNDLENFLYMDVDIPSLIKIAIIHAQFETIHPFLDGNGRMGRLLITFWLCQQQILTEPLLYLSYYFKLNRSEYYERLMNIRTKGQWEEWIKFFLKGVSVVSDEATESAKKIIELKETYTAQFYKRTNINAVKLLEALFDQPIMTKRMASDVLGTSYPTAANLIEEFVSLGVLQDMEPDRQRDKRYIFGEYMHILERGTELTEKI